MRRQEIEHLTPLEHVRLRPGMYVGDCSDPTQLLIEILANAIDEHNAGHGDVISVISSQERNMYTVVDYGRGFPINELDDQEGKTVLQLACDTPNTSGKFREDGSYNGVSTGCNGLGMVLTNFLSHEFIIASYRGGIEEYDRYVEQLKDLNLQPSVFHEGVTQKELERLVKKYHGTGMYDPNPLNGSPREKVDTGVFLGQYWDTKKGKLVDTTWLELVYSKHGTHVYSVEPPKRV